MGCIYVFMDLCRYKYLSLYVLLAVALCSCMEYGPRKREEFGPAAERGLFIVGEGNFTYGNATLSFYDPIAGSVENDVFGRANGIKLGDVAQSMTMHDSRGWVVVNNSGIVFAIDADTYRITGAVDGLSSPRHIHFVGDTKAYVTDLYTPRIAIVDPRTCTITGYIDTEGHRSTEQMVQWGRWVFTNCWSYDNTVLVIDSEEDRVVAEIEVGIQPTSLVIDRYDKLWVITNGGYEGSPYGYEAPALYRLDAATFAVEQEFRFTKGEHLSCLCIDGEGGTLYFINDAVWRMDVTAAQLPARPFIESRGTIYYSLAVDPLTSEIYLADAIDYQQPGIVYRYNPDGSVVDSFRVGVTPGAFCFK